MNSNQDQPPTWPVVQIMWFDAKGRIDEIQAKSLEEVREHASTHKLVWINVDGPIDKESLSQIGQLFNLHSLALEDVLNTNQRAKVEHYGEHCFTVMRMVSLKKKLESEQVSMFFNPKGVITFQERAGGDCLDPVRQRIREGAGDFEKAGADYLAYAIIDAIIDGYFPVLEKLGDRLEHLEETVLKNGKHAPTKIHDVKRDVLALRRHIWPIRDAVNTLQRENTKYVSAKVKVFMRDCYDHAIRIMDLVEMDRELCADLMALYQSALSNRTNEVMKVLAIITTLFIPASFVASVYGMNFNTSTSPLNMPELNWWLGYPFALFLMVALMGGLFFWLWRKGWVYSPDSEDSDDE